jgi:hypothetical protein
MRETNQSEAVLLAAGRNCRFRGSVPVSHLRASRAAGLRWVGLGAVASFLLAPQSVLGLSPKVPSRPAGAESASLQVSAQAARLTNLVAVIDSMVARHFGQTSPQEQDNWRRLVGATGVLESSAFTKLQSGTSHGCYHMETWVALSHLVEMQQNGLTNWLASFPMNHLLQGQIAAVKDDYAAQLRAWNKEAQRLYASNNAKAQQRRLSHVLRAQQRFFSAWADRLAIGPLLQSNHELATGLCLYHYQKAGVGAAVPMRGSLDLGALARIWVQRFNRAGPAQERSRQVAFVRRNGEADAQVFHRLLDQKPASVPTGFTLARRS